ncbi:efflux RND transporter periplasmic adaptor subunit [Lishizhenia sp.]|uniref:efflux RND transporter periplasmic adaptor subunit n=1 Tax=Lishizhenia sp. TaxID=2497594 RepID=UPI00299DE5F6|nr:efflux RND transporter periplasmic adaptor subunit [Lishizhenia sp.]MDX1446760.1 efflux RND transporter periplasmic adaptor subunit [Lishizhenia sp.]
MDIKLEQSFWERHRLKFIVIGGVLGILALITYYLQNNVVEIPNKQLKFAEVNYGEFQEIVIANGSVQPKRTILIDANEGGSVLQKMKEDGDTVKAGEVLLSLQNEALVLEYMQRETQVVEQLNNLRNTQITLHQNLRRLEDDYALTKKEKANICRSFKGDSAVFAQRGLAQLEYEKQKDEKEYTLNRLNVLKGRLEEDQHYLQVQNDRIEASIVLMERNLEMIRSKIEEMQVLVPLSGRLTSFDVEIGQVLSANEIVARVDVPGAYKIVALVDQHYLNRVVVGQKASFKVQGNSYDLYITKVKQNVVNGQFEIELLFEDEQPESLSRGQSFQVAIAISGKEETLKIPRGAYFSSSGGKFVYVVKGDKAYQRRIVLGKQNPRYYQVIEGLEEGEQIITSSYDGYLKEKEIIILK